MELITPPGRPFALYVVTVKFEALVAVPPGVVTASRPLEVPSWTVALMDVSEITIKVVRDPFTVTALAPVKPVPVILTAVSGDESLEVDAPLVGVKEVIVGAEAGVIVKCPVLIGDSPRVVTTIGPVLALGGTTALSNSSEIVVKLVARMPLNSTAVVCVKPLPRSITVVPTGPAAGVKEASSEGAAPEGGGAATAMVTVFDAYIP
jgi:hypothetical protein